MEERGRWLHLLPDRLTGKTNCEMRLELLLLKECYKYGVALQERLTAFYNRAMVAHGGWELLMEELAGCDFTPLQDNWLTDEFRCVCVRERDRVTQNHLISLSGRSWTSWSCSECHVLYSHYNQTCDHSFTIICIIM